MGRAAARETMNGLAHNQGAQSFSTPTGTPVTLIEDDCRNVLRAGPKGWADAIICDPGVGSLSDVDGWVNQVPGPTYWSAILRAAKPGAHMAVFAGRKTLHRVMTHAENVGWEIRDTLMWVFACLSDDSEILTEKGWQHWSETRVGDLAMCYDSKQDEFSWQPIQAVHNYPFDGNEHPLYRIHSDHTDQLVTGNHRCPVERNGVVEFIEARELAREHEAHVPILGNVSDLLRDLPLPQQVPSPQQQNLPLGLLQDVGPKSSQGHQGEQRSMWGWFHNFLRGAVTSAARGGSRLLPARPGKFRGGISGEAPQRPRGGGSMGVASRGGDKPYVQGRSSAFDWPLQPDEPCVPLGPQAVRASRFTTSDLVRVESADYTGVVWCVTVPTGAFVARRKGKAFVTGNSGMPMALDIGQAVDRKMGGDGEPYFRTIGSMTDAEREAWIATRPGNPWYGWGTELRPTWEPIVIFRRPIGEGSVAANHLTYGTGAMNIDATRINSGERDAIATYIPEGQGEAHGLGLQKDQQVVGTTTLGRWPSDALFSHDYSCSEDHCVQGCPVGILDTQDPGRREGPSRFFFCPKASRHEKDLGIGHKGNDHKAVKPVAVTDWLVNLISPPGGLVLDPFAGTCSTGLSAVRLAGATGPSGFVGIDTSGSWLDMGRTRLMSVLEL